MTHARSRHAVENRRRAAPLVVLAALTMLVTACGGGGGGSDESEESTTPAGVETAFEKVLDGIGDDGTVGKETALAAFSLAIAPLPGVKVPAGDPGPIPDGSGAIAWVLRQYDDLTPAQQRAVGDALGGETSSASEGGGHSLRAPGYSADVRLAASGSAPKGCYGQTLVTKDSPGSEKYRALVDEMIDEVGSRIGISFPLTTYVVLESRAAPKDKSDAFTWGDRTDCSQNTLETCTIHFNPRAQSDTERELRAVVAHEVTHCYVFAHLGAKAYDLPPWLGEGFPGWAGENIANGSPVSTRWWRKYLTNPGKALFGRVYDGIGFYAHLDESGTDPWSVALSMLDAFANEPAWQAAVGSGNDAFLDTWPSGFAREPARSRAWDTRMPGITSDKAGLQRREIANGQSLTESSPPAANRVVALAVAGDVLVVESDSSGLLASGNDEVAIRSAGNLCIRDGGCECPADTEGAGQSITDFDPPERLAVTGGLAQGTVKLTVISLEDWCGNVKSKVDPCLVAHWVSTRIDITDEATNAGGTELGGGDGVVMTIGRDGAVVVDHNGMKPIRSEVNGLGSETTISGVSHATIEAMNGQLTMTSNDFSSTATSQLSFGSVTGRPLAGSPILASGTYQCSGSTMHLTHDYPLGKVNADFSKQ